MAGDSVMAMPGLWALGAAFLLLALALWLYSASRSTRAATGLPEGEVIYTDDGVWQAQRESLTSPTLRLTGRPDYLVRQSNGLIIPVEVKSAESPPHPHLSHVMQLAAYCLLVDEHFGVRPSHGILQYRDNAFAIDYTEELEADLLDTLANMRSAMFDEVDSLRHHSSPARCRACGVRAACDERLA